MNTMYPPVSTDCPDYWTVNADGTCNIPTNGKNLGTLNGQEIYKYTLGGKERYSYLSEYDPGSSTGTIKGTLYTNEQNKVLGYYKSEIPSGYNESTPQMNWVDFNDPGWSVNGTSECAISKWAKINNIAWDGLTNYNQC